MNSGYFFVKKTDGLCTAQSTFWGDKYWKKPFTLGSELSFPGLERRIGKEEKGTDPATGHPGRRLGCRPKRFHLASTTFRAERLGTSKNRALRQARCERFPSDRSVPFVPSLSKPERGRYFEVPAGVSDYHMGMVVDAFIGISPMTGLKSRERKKDFRTFGQR
ncbi:hypothetical protein ACWJKU_07900 [Methylocaldum sp. MU1018]